MRQWMGALLPVCSILAASCTTGGARVTSPAPDPSLPPTGAAIAPAPPVAKGSPELPSPPTAQPTYAAEVEQRITRVIRGLLPITERSTRFGAPADLAERMRYYHTPGVSVAVIHDGKIEWARGFGVRDVESRQPVTPETMFQAASISKPVFALAIMRLVEQGKVQLDEDVSRYLDSWKVPPSGQWQGMVTLRELLSHSAGLTVHGFPGYHAGEPLPTVTQILDGKPPANTPAVRMNILPEVSLRYSGGGTIVAQLAVTDLLDQPFPRILQELVLGPLGMTHSTYEQPLPDGLKGSAATAHPWKSEPLVGRWHTYPEMGAAGLWTTPADLCKVGLEVQRAVRGESPLLAKKLADEMLTRQMGDAGIGFFLKGKDESLRFGHGGWNEGFVSMATFYKKRGMGAVVMVNSNEGQPILEEIERAIAREYGWPDYFEEEKKRIDLDAAALDRLTGDYETEKGLRVVLSRDGSDLLLVVGKQPAVRLAPYAPAKLFALDLELEVSFKVEGKRPAESVTLQQGRSTLEAKRKPGPRAARR